MTVGWASKREFWSRHLRQWHWISSAVCLVLMLLFAASGITLNHADYFEGKGESVSREFPLSEEMSARLARLENGHVLPDAIAAELHRQTGAELFARTIDNQYGELGFDLARPGVDASLTIDLNARKIFLEEVDRGPVAMVNDLHKGRNTGPAWKLLIDIGAAFFLLFTLTGFGLLFLQARRRASTWPLAGTVSFEIPKIDTFPYRKPYVAVWLEDGGGQQVKTLAVLHDQARIGGRWIPELRSWWRTGGRTMTMPADGISRPTQAPGRQTVGIPGIDQLAPGRYSVVVEAAREKGGRELVKVPFELKRGKSASASASGDAELGKVSVSIRP